MSLVLRVARQPLVRVAVSLIGLVLVALLLWLRGPNWAEIADKFTTVRWEWVAVAIGINLASVVVRAMAWRVVIDNALPPPHPSHLLVFSAFCVGLLGNIVIPGRAGEIARVAVLVRRLPRRAGTWPTLVGTVFAHRVFDLVPSLLLIVAVLVAAPVPDWARTSLTAVTGVGILLIVGAIAAAHRGAFAESQEMGKLRALIIRARQGLGIMRDPVPALAACLLQCTGWFLQLLAVYTTMRAFHLHQGLTAAALVLVLINVATIVPLWPGNVGVTQAAIALPLNQYYGTPRGKGFAFGIGLQAIEASVGIGVGLVFLAREGLSVAMLRGMQAPEEGSEDADQAEPARARVPG